MKYDVVIIGGGITGTGIAHELAKYQLKTILLESGTDVAFSATKQNGGVIHPGYDPHPGTLKAKLNPPAVFSAIVSTSAFATSLSSRFSVSRPTR